MKTYDCFIINDEWELLKLRLEMLKDTVDYFLLVESPLTHSGVEKPLYFDELFKYQIPETLCSRIIHVVTDPPTVALPDSNLTWTRERHQRNDIMEGLVQSGVAADDLILVSDIDELPSPVVLQELLMEKGKRNVCFFQTLYCYYLNFRNVAALWRGTMMRRFDNMDEPHKIRYRCHEENGDFACYSGWHFTYMGGVEACKRKIRAYAHQEYNTEESFAKLEDGFKNLHWFLDEADKRRYALTLIDESYPDLVRANVEYYKKLGWIYDIQQQQKENG